MRHHKSAGIVGTFDSQFYIFFIYGKRRKQLLQFFHLFKSSLCKRYKEIGINPLHIYQHKSTTHQSSTDKQLHHITKCLPIGKNIVINPLATVDSEIYG